MCGIFGIVDLGAALGNAVPLDEARFSAGLATLHHRGPDGQYVVRVDEGVLFGHARLSIIDLSDDSNQPFDLGDRYWLTYNGEIFNYIELRQELEALGVTFRSAGDVEVLLQAYIHWGTDCVSRFNGMWAFAIWDKQERTLFASRDRFGIKPFNYAEVDGQLLFASEIKAMLAYHPALAEPEYNMIANFCRTSVGAQHEQTWFKRVKRLMPGTNMLVRDGQISLSRYWTYPTEKRTDLSFDEARDQYRALFDDAVRIRMRSDVPLGITLSAGVDSNSIAEVMQSVDPSPHYALTAGYRAGEQPELADGIYIDAGDAVDEPAVARRTAARLGMQFELVETGYDDFVGELERIIWHLESGNSSPAVVPLMQLLDHARHHMTVVMDGQGADELLAGYSSGLIAPQVGGLLRRGKWRAAWRAIQDYRTIWTLRWAIMISLRKWASRWPAIAALRRRMSGLEAIYGPQLRSSFAPMADTPLQSQRSHDGVNTQLLHEHSGGLVNLLHYGDAISMAASLEARMPFLDHRLVEYVWGLPSEFKISGVIGKHIHREAMRGRVPDTILNAKIKYGFPTPIDEQFMRVAGGHSPATLILLSDRCKARGLFDRTKLQALLQEHVDGKAAHGALLFRLLLTELWHCSFIDDRRGVAAVQAVGSVTELSNS